MMCKLYEVQNEVVRQLTRDYGAAQGERLRTILMLGLSEEVGEVLGLEKRRYRNNARDVGAVTRERYVEELGDALWYLTAVCAALGTNLDEIWEYNKSKLEKRYAKND